MGNLKKNILLVSSGDVNGAYEAIYKIAKILIADGHLVKMLVRQKTKAEHFIVQYPNSENTRHSVFNRIVRKLVHLTGKPNRIVPKSDRNYFFLSHDELSANIDAQLALKVVGFVPDVIISGMTDGFMNSTDLNALQKASGAKGFTLAVDMNHFTGGCHYAWDCQRYFTVGCNSECPALAPANPKTREIAAINFQAKLKNMTEANFESIVMSEWTAKQAQQSLIYKKQRRVYNINSIIDMTVFNNANKDIAKRVFGFEQNKFYILTGSQNSRDERKGFRYLSEALKIVENKLSPELKSKVVIAVVSHAISTEFDGIGLNKKKIDYITDYRLLALLYQASDLFVNTSIEDAGPMMVSEALASGTPVVGFEMGVVTNMVNDGNGYVAPLRDSHRLAEGLLKFITMTNDEYQQYSKNAYEQVRQFSSFEYVSKILEECINQE